MPESQIQFVEGIEEVFAVEDGAWYFACLFRKFLPF